MSTVDYIHNRKIQKELISKVYGAECVQENSCQSRVGVIDVHDEFSRLHSDPSID